VVLVSLALALVLSAAAATGQPATKVHRIGYLGAGTPTSSPGTDAFVDGLRELGYVDGRNVRIEYRWSEGSAERLPALAAELVALKVDVIVVGGGRAISAAREATRTIPIVVAFTSDLAGAGLVASVARPGGNVTGLSAMSPELSAKRVELLHEVVPKVASVAALWSSEAGKDLRWDTTHRTAAALGITLRSFQVRSADELEAAFAAMRREQSGALLVFNDRLTNTHRAAIIALAARHRVPAMYDMRAYVDDGGLMSYGPDVPAIYRRAASYVDRILRGARPADLPVEQPSHFELVVNRKTAAALGLAIPPSVLLRATRLVE
jgi:putative ABC transport system substrate-binding protein